MYILSGFPYLRLYGRGVGDESLLSVDVCVFITVMSRREGGRWVGMLYAVW
jgi:hypothetical protein